MERLYKKYPNFFGIYITKSGEIRGRNKESNWFSQKWGWADIIWSIAEEGIFGTVDEVEQRFVNEIINYINYKNDKYEYRKEEQNKQDSLNKLKEQGRKKFK